MMLYFEVPHHIVISYVLHHIRLSLVLMARAIFATDFVDKIISARTARG